EYATARAASTADAIMV
ncbi:hypothetical protein A2U01_0102221, partial [Trifolium medium]|nr:hypothetical protein [Trifolium medium]